MRNSFSVWICKVNVKRLFWRPRPCGLTTLKCFAGRGRGVTGPRKLGRNCHIQDCSERSDKLSVCVRVKFMCRQNVCQCYTKRLQISSRSEELHN